MKRTSQVLVLSFLAILGMASSIHADGVILLKGNLTSVTESHYLVETKNSIYYINRNAVAAPELKAGPKSVEQVEWSVPMDSIHLVKAKPRPVSSRK